MIQLIFFTFIAVGSVVAFSNWRLGIFLMMIAGMLQDPVRKLMPGTPGYMVLAFVPIFFALYAGLYTRGQPWSRFIASFPAMAPRVAFFLLSLLMAFVIVLFNYGFAAWQVGIIGLMTYVFPLIAISIGFWFLPDIDSLKRLITFYCVTSALMLIGGLLEHWDIYPEWAALGTEALDMIWIRHVPGYIVDLTSGFYRSPDILGWHAALLVMLSVIMSIYSRSFAGKLLWVGLVSWGLLILVMSGRNKMIFMPAVFLSVVFLAYLFKGKVERSLMIVLAGALGIGLFWGINSQIQLDQEYFLYVGEGTTTAPERLRTHGVQSVWTTFQQSGFFGEGLGSASTGARFGGAKGFRTWQESGTSKVMVELGVTGFLAIILLGWTIVQWLFGLLRRLPSHSDETIFFIGLMGILAANTASFTISHQIFGDPFIVTMTGFFLGLALSAPRWLRPSDRVTESTRPRLKNIRERHTHRPAR